MIYTIENTPQCHVFVDGVEVKNVISADTDAGIVTFCPQPLRVAADGESVVTEELRGVVKVVLK